MMKTIDYIDNIIVPNSAFAKPANEYYALCYLKRGVDFLYNQVAQCENEMKNRIPLDKYKIVLVGNVPELKGMPLEMLTCSFQWYAISACQYVKTVAAIAYKLDANRPRPDEYAKKIIPEVVAYRDKVAAHFSWTTKHRADNEADRLISVMPQIVYINGRFKVGSFLVTVKIGEKKESSESIKPWSLTETHERFVDRYWREQE